MAEKPPTAAEIKRVMTALSRRGAAKGGHARAAALSSARRSQIARNAVATRERKRKRRRRH